MALEIFPPFFKICFCFVCVEACLHVYMRTTHVPGAWGGQKRELNPLELEFQMTVSHREVNLGPLQVEHCS